MIQRGWSYSIARSTRHISLLSLPTFTSHHISSAECGIASNRTYIWISVTLHFQIWLRKRKQVGIGNHE